MLIENVSMISSPAVSNAPVAGRGVVAMRKKSIEGRMDGNQNCDPEIVAYTDTLGFHQKMSNFQPAFQAATEHKVQPTSVDNKALEAIEQLRAELEAEKAARIAETQNAKQWEVKAKKAEARAVQDTKMAIQELRQRRAARQPSTPQPNRSRRAPTRAPTPSNASKQQIQAEYLKHAKRNRHNAERAPSTCVMRTPSQKHSDAFETPWRNATPRKPWGSVCSKTWSRAHTALAREKSITYGFQKEVSLPRKEGAPICASYKKHGFCNMFECRGFCHFDHPPLGDDHEFQTPNAKAII